MKKAIISLALVFTLLFLAVVPCAASTVTLISGSVSNYYKTVSGYSAGVYVDGYQRIASLSGVLVTMDSISGHRAGASSTKVVSFKVNATSESHTSYVSYETRSTGGSLISSLTQATVSSTSATFYKTKSATYTGSICLYPYGQAVYSTVTYEGYPVIT